MAIRVLEEDAYKSYQRKPVDTKVNSCVNVVEDIIETFSSKNKTCKNCRKLVADIISFHLVGGHELDARERKGNDYGISRYHY
jgi:5-methylcytosine-specific restriction endonuclease McrA